MNYLRIILPLILVAYFLVKAVHNRIFLLGIPFLHYLDQTIFFENLHVFWMPGRLPSTLLAFIWLVLIWVICIFLDVSEFRWNDQINVFSSPKLLPQEVPLLLLGVIWIIHFFTSYSTNPDIVSILSGIGGDLAYMLLGYFIVRGIVARASQDQIFMFLDSLVYVNIITCILFILHQGFHQSIYIQEGVASYNGEIAFLGEIMTRSTWYFPPLFGFSFSYIISKRKIGFIQIAMLIVLIYTALISFTRTIIIGMVITLFIMVLANLIKSRPLSALRNWLIISGTIVLAFFVMARFAPTQWQFLVSRTMLVLKDPSDPNANSLFIRQQFLVNTWDMISRSQIFGSGFCRCTP